MDFFKINSKTISSPKDISLSYEVLDKAERTMDGTMVIDVIGKKRKIDVSWDYMSKADMTLLATEIRSNSFVTISFNDSITGQLVSIEARPENINYSPYYNWVKNEIMWKSIDVSFIER